jgi:hypothetical protein
MKMTLVNINLLIILLNIVLVKIFYQMILLKNLEQLYNSRGFQFVIFYFFIK